ncbi:MAG: hypothetical protein P1V97_33205 [Planctomycetota bacterium]|nr:hypothetical protein [Planctomycetota bacterium]
MGNRQRSELELVEVRGMNPGSGEGADSWVTVTVRGDRTTIERLLGDTLASVKVTTRKVHRKPSKSTGPKDSSKKFRDFWRKLQPGRRKGLLAAACFLHKTGHQLFCRSEIEHLLSFLSDKERPILSQRSLIHLARRGFIERKKRGVYAVQPSGLACIEEISNQRERKRPKRQKKVVKTIQTTIRLDGISPFLRSVPSSTLWLKTLLCGYFLRRYCGVEEFNREMIASCFRRVRGLHVPGSLPAVLSQVLFKQYGYIEPRDSRGFYTITDEAFEDLQTRAYVLAAERKLDRIRSPVDEEVTKLSNQDSHRASA